MAARLAEGYAAAKDSAEYTRMVFDQHVAVTGARARMMEVGPGGNVAVAALYVKAGADSAACIDSVPWPSEQDDLYRQLGVTDVLDRVQYFSPVALETCDLPDGSFGVILSHATLAHLRPGASGGEPCPLLARGGVRSTKSTFATTALR